MTATVPASTGARTAVLRRRVRLIVGVTITYNAIEAVIALAAGAVADSTALFAFGLDSIVEVLSAGAVAWQFAGGRNHESREHTALRIVAFSFFALAAVVSADALRSLLGAGEAEHSIVGIVLAAVSLAVMPGLSWLERGTGRELGSASVVADSKQTLICAALSAVLLVGLLANSVLGWSWADPIAALVIAAFAVREGIEALRGDTCCTPVAAMLADDDIALDDDCGCAQGCDDGCCTPASATTGAPQDVEIRLGRPS